jgi:hypothetical protein
MTRFSAKTYLVMLAVGITPVLGFAGGELSYAPSGPEAKVQMSAQGGSQQPALKGAALEAFMRYSNSGDPEKGREMVAITQSRDAALAISNAAAHGAVVRRLETVASKVYVPGPVQDKYGDPMYTSWGPLPYHDTPLYDGPRYHASFERQTGPMIYDGQDRSYYRGAYSHPKIVSPTDQTLGAGASQSYIQSGMMAHPGSMPSSVSRVITNNRW